MSFYDLPTSVDVSGISYEIRSDYRAVLDIITALNDIELTTMDKAMVALQIFYVEFEQIPQEHYGDALQECFKFIDLGKELTDKKSPKLMDWEQDFQYIVAPINKASGQDIRHLPYMHWWTFMGYYYDIGECTFSTIVSIRNKKAKGKKLEKYEKEYYRDNREIIDFKQNYSSMEEELLKNWGGG